MSNREWHEEQAIGERAMRETGPVCIQCGAEAKEGAYPAGPCPKAVAGDTTHTMRNDSIVGFQAVSWSDHSYFEFALRGDLHVRVFEDGFVIIGGAVALNPREWQLLKTTVDWILDTQQPKEET